MKYKVVFLGTPEFAKESLKAIHESEHEVVGVVTVADKPAGRGNKLLKSPVKIYAEDHHIPLLQPEKLKNKAFLEALKAWDADIFVVVAFRMLPNEVWQMPPKGTFNLHASLLPQYRGAAPINYAVINGETKTGNTTFFLQEKVDTGDLLLQQEIPILPEDNAGSLHDKLMQNGAELVVQTLDGLWDNHIIPQPQKNIKNPFYAHKIFKEDCEINWNDSIENIHHKIRGLSPYPAAWTTVLINDQVLQLKIYKAHIEIEKQTDYLHHFIQDKNNLIYIHPQGKIYLTDVQLEGKKRLPVKDFLNGLKHSVSLFNKPIS